VITYLRALPEQQGVDLVPTQVEAARGGLGAPGLRALQWVGLPALAPRVLVAHEGEVVDGEGEQVGVLVPCRARVDARHRARLRRQLPHEREEAVEVPADDGIVQVNRIILAEVRLELVASIEQDVDERD
jgi:hypothetical protein